MDITERQIGAATVLVLRGRLTLESFGLLKTRVRSLLKDGKCALVLDLSAVSYVDSIGVAELVRSHVMATRSGGRLALAALSAQVDELLRVTRLDQILDAYATPAQAVDHLARTNV